MRHIESNIQTLCVKWFRIHYPEIRYSLVAIPNGGARSRITGAILKGEGVVAGAPDLVLFIPNKDYHALMIEMKTPTGRQSDSQKDFQTRGEAAGYQYAIVRSFDQFRELIDTYLNNR